MMALPKKFYVLTGGPGAGKTTLLNSLNALGFTTVPEEARKIIQQQMAVDGVGLPWKDKEAYAELMLNASIETYTKHRLNNSEETVFFDRGILDTICYMKMENISVTPATENLIKQHPYNKNVFLLPPWQEIYTKDAERRQTWKEVLFTYEKMKETYSEYGYHIVEVPKASAAQRTLFVNNFIKSSLL